MYSENYMEIVLTGLGWDFYSKLVMFVYTLNLHLLPFGIVMLKNWWDTRRSQEAGQATLVEWRRGL
jgi:purine-cytosine permease-like protein